MHGIIDRLERFTWQWKSSSIAILATVSLAVADIVLLQAGDPLVVPRKQKYVTLVGYLSYDGKSEASEQGMFDAAQEAIAAHANGALQQKHPHEVNTQMSASKSGANPSLRCRCVALEQSLGRQASSVGARVLRSMLRSAKRQTDTGLKWFQRTTMSARAIYFKA